MLILNHKKHLEAQSVIVTHVKQEERGGIRREGVYQNRVSTKIGQMLRPLPRS